MLEIERTCKDKQNAMVVVMPDGKTLTFYVTWIGDKRCKLKFDMHPDFIVLRKELYEKIKEEKKALDASVIVD